MATSTPIVSESDHFFRTREVAIRLSLIALLALTCFVILKAFIPLLAWGVIIATAGYPGYRKLAAALGGREKLAAVLCTLILLSLIVIPAVLLAGTLTDGARSIASQVQSGNFRIPPPPAKVQGWPLIGKPLNKVWTTASTDATQALNKVSPVIQKYAPTLLSAGAKLGGTLLQFILSIVLAGFLLASSRGNAEFSQKIFRRIFREKGDEFETLTANTVRSVTNGIVGVALIQTILASLGFLVVGLPGAGMWSLLFFVAAVLQVGVVVLLPAVAFAFTITSTTPAVIFLVWCMFVGVIDNVLKPMLLGRGNQVPTLVVFLGVIGGFIAMGTIGLFIGAIILSVGYKLFLIWLEDV
ncbi:protein of unknown function UPF0118 [Candidatus Koribacter versatilis Ellin345]|uniref:Permease n=1 Tax=Koribacter versatilis (strain Ellin345) TaxID=204669 RepID=Q1IPN0_KORVE|nr:AI-2E family transporter [Candidatus Koribacter versatilis]ABF41170.1 protein of unknown function UPF0118 [Candidatus Koribacter versatilis Ellin345]